MSNPHRLWHLRRSTLVLPLVAALVALAATTAPAAVGAERGEVPSDRPLGQAVDARAASSGVFQTVDGVPIEVIADEGDEGERTVTGISGDGSPVQIHVQSSAITESDRVRVADTIAAVPSREALQFSEQRPKPVSGVISATALSHDPRDWEVVSVVGFTDDSASFAWLGHDEFAVYEGDRLVGNADDGQFLALGLKAGISYSFTMIGSSEEDEKSGTDTLTSSRMITFETFSATRTDDERLVAPLTWQPYYNQYIHKTFIPNARVGGLQCNVTDPFNNWEFGGDNRTYQYPAFDTPWEEPDYRTMMFVNINWDNPYPYDILWTKNVGATPVYKNGALDRTLYASTDAMTFHDAEAGLSYAKIRLQHFGSNPGCAILDFNYSGAITYGELVEFYRSGTIAVDGSRFRAPAHEMYGGFTPPSGSHVVWKQIARLPNEGFQCLLGPLFCHPEFYDLSASY